MMRTHSLRGILRVEKDGDDLFFGVYHRQRSLDNCTDDIQLLLEIDRKGIPESKGMVSGEVRIFSMKGCLVYSRGTWGYDDDDMWFEDLVLKPRKRYIKRYPSRPEPKEQ